MVFFAYFPVSSAALFLEQSQTCATRAVAQIQPENMPAFIDVLKVSRKEMRLCCEKKSCLVDNAAVSEIKERMHL